MRAAAPADRATAALRFLLRLWPLALVGLFVPLGRRLWRDLVLLGHPDPAGDAYRLLYQAWPAAGLALPVLVMLASVAAVRLGRGSRVTAVAAGLAAFLATAVTVAPELRRLVPFLGTTAPLDLPGLVDRGALFALAFGFVGCAAAVRLWRAERPGRSRLGRAAPLDRAPSDTHGHADWLDPDAARRLFPGPDPAYGGLVVGEAYRVDRDRGARGAFDPDDPGTWGKGGTAPLLVDPCRSGPTHALVLAGSGGFKTTSTAVPTLLAWTASAVVLDPSRETGPMTAGFRRSTLGHTVVTLDPADPEAGGFNALDWIDTRSPLAEAHVDAVASWLAGEPARGVREGGAEFFRDMGRSLIACLLADLLWHPDPAAERSLRRLRRVLVTPEDELRGVLRGIHENSPSPLARDLAGTLMGLVAETFSGVYANADKATRWLSVAAYARLVSGNTFRTADLAAGRLTVFVQIPLKVLEASPGLGRVVIGSLLNAAYEADGRLNGRVLFLLDEVARLGPMAALETARDAGRKYGLTLLLLYQSVGQLVQQWGRDGARAWYDGTSWRAYANLQDPDTARELSAVCGELGVVTMSRGDTTGRQGRFGHRGTSSGTSSTRAETRRSLIKPDELLHDARADEQFVVARGARPLRCGRALYFRRPEMAAAVAPSRFHAGTPADAARSANH